MRSYHDPVIDPTFLTATVVQIWIAPGARLDMQQRTAAEMKSGHGITGDRYENARHRQVTVQSAAQLAEAAAELGTEILPQGTRRNITVSAGAVPLAPGTRFSIGPVHLEVVRVAAPCTLLDDDIGRGAKKALHRRAGAVCRVLRGGSIAVGDPIADVASLDPAGTSAEALPTLKP